LLTTVDDWLSLFGSDKTLPLTAKKVLYGRRTADSSTRWRSMINSMRMRHWIAAVSRASCGAMRNCKL